MLKTTYSQLEKKADMPAKLPVVEIEQSELKEMATTKAMARMQSREDAFKKRKQLAVCHACVEAACHWQNMPTDLHTMRYTSDRHRHTTVTRMNRTTRSKMTSSKRKITCSRWSTTSQANAVWRTSNCSKCLVVAASARYIFCKRMLFQITSSLRCPRDRSCWFARRATPHYTL